MKKSLKDNQSPRVVGLGEVLWDVFPDGKRFGGAPANFACHAASLGAQAFIASAVGTDELGDVAIESLSQRNVDATCVGRSLFSTGRVLVNVSEGGQPVYKIENETAWDHLIFTPECQELAGCCDAVCFGSLAQRSPSSREFIERFLEATSEGCIKVFDVNLRQDFYSEAIVLNSLNVADVLKLNDEELPVVCELVGVSLNEGHEVDSLRELRQKFDLNLIALSQGSRGSTLVSEFEMNVCPAVETEVCDTVGAGDAFTAAITLGLLNGDSLESTNQYANRVAAFVCTQQGATPTLAIPRKS